MAEQMKFRSAVNGFNRTDVCRYIEFLSNSHNVKVNQLHTEIGQLRAELEEKLAADAGQDSPSEYCTQLETQLAEMQQRLADTENALTAARNRAQEAEAACTAARRRVEELETSLPIPQPDTAAQDARLAEARQRIAALEADLTVARQRNAELEQALTSARTAAPAVSQDLTAQELAAYRRAERVERMAISRARDMMTQMKGVLHDTTARVDEDAVELSELFDQLSAQFDRLRQRMLASKSTLKDAVTALHTIPAEGNED